MRRGLAALVVVLALAPAAAARPLLGVHGGLDRFEALTGQRSAGTNVFVHWGQGQTWGSSFARLFASMGDVPILSVNPKADLTPLELARGDGDAYLVALNHGLAAWGDRIYVR